VDREGQQTGAVWLRLNYMIDTAHAVIVDVEATPARTYDEMAATRIMIDRTGKVFGLKPKSPSQDFFMDCRVFAA
jgi:hypothetical protein